MRGLRVLPLHVPTADGCSCRKGASCPTPGKHPRVLDWENKATTDADVIDGWWTSWPGSNVGILCGNGLVVLDVDTNGFEPLAKLGTIPNTPTVLTGGDGGHFYFVALEDVASFDLAPGLECRARGRLVVAPPSRHASGREYVWERSLDVPMALAPAWLVRRPRRSTTPMDGKVPEGGRHDAMLRLAGAMRRVGAGTGEIEAALSAFNRDRCEPPEDETVVRDLAADVAERYAPADDETGEQLREQLTAALRLGDGLSAEASEIHGHGPSAVVKLHLSDGGTIRADRFSDLFNVSRLSALVVAATGRAITFKAPECANVAALVVRLAKHHDAVTDEDVTREWGAAFLRAAQPLDLDMTDQRQRWAAFVRLDEIDPLTTARQSGGSVASASVVLRDTGSQARYVHSGWFLAHVRRDVGTVGASELVNRMSMAGWKRRGQRGRLKATSPSGPDTIQLPLYIVPSGWEDQ